MNFCGFRVYSANPLSLFVIREHFFRRIFVNALCDYGGPKFSKKVCGVEKNPRKNMGA